MRWSRSPIGVPIAVKSSILGSVSDGQWRSETVTECNDLNSDLFHINDDLMGSSVKVTLADYRLQCLLSMSVRVFHYLNVSLIAVWVQFVAFIRQPKRNIKRSIKASIHNTNRFPFGNCEKYLIEEINWIYLAAKMEFSNRKLKKFHFKWNIIGVEWAMKTRKVCSVIKVSLISITLFAVWILIPSLVINRRKLNSYLTLSEFTAINVKINYPNIGHNSFQWSDYPPIDPNNVNKILIITEARSGSTFLGLLTFLWLSVNHKVIQSVPNAP